VPTRRLHPARGPASGTAVDRLAGSSKRGCPDRASRAALSHCDREWQLRPAPRRACGLDACSSTKRRSVGLLVSLGNAAVVAHCAGVEQDQRSPVALAALLLADCYGGVITEAAALIQLGLSETTRFRSSPTEGPAHVGIGRRPLWVSWAAASAAGRVRTSAWPIRGGHVDADDGLVAVPSARCLSSRRAKQEASCCLAASPVGLHANDALSTAAARVMWWFLGWRPARGS